MHFGIILTRFSEDVDNASARAHLVARPVIDNCRHLHARTNLHLLLSVSILAKLEHSMDCIHVVTKRLEISCLILLLLDRTVADLLPAIAFLVRLRERNRDIVWHETALHEHPRLICNYMENTDERLRRPLDYLHDFSFPSLTIKFLTCNGHTHSIAV